MDRLSSLLDRFRLKVVPAEPTQANLGIVKEDETENCILFFKPRGYGFPRISGQMVLSLNVDFGNVANPLRIALPDEVVETVHPDSDLHNLISLLISEDENSRCGAPVVLGRLGEVLVVRILRMQLERGATTPGILSGLSHQRISKAIVAMHEKPEIGWRNSDLAEISGLSQSRFKELFSSIVGEAPMGYLRRWRMVLARIDLENGERVDRVSHKYGYKAPDAFSRAFTKEFGDRPREFMKA